MILAKPTAGVLSKFVYDRTGFRAADVTCPSGVPARAGQRFQCHFTGPDGKYIAYMTVARVRGSRVDYQIQTERVGHTINAAAAEKIVVGFVAKHTGAQARDVRCPSGVIPLLGHTLTCHFTGPDGRYTASLVVTSVNGATIGYRIRTSRVGP